MRGGTNLERVLREGHFAVTAELGPPKGTEAEVVRRKALMLKDYIDALNVTDNQTAIVRMCPLACCAIIRGLGADPVMQITTRDRNRLAIQSDVLGAQALGIGNFLCLSGDHQGLGNHPTAKGVYDLDSIGLIFTLRKMRDERRFLCGEDISGDVRMFIGAVENPFAEPIKFRARRLAKKVNAGAQFIQTQAVYDVECFARFMELVGEQGLLDRVYILAGIIPLKSVRMARYIRERVAGIYIPEKIMERMASAKDEKHEGLNIALETIDRVMRIPGVRGIHIMAVGWEEIVPEIVQRAGLYPRPRIE